MICKEKQVHRQKLVLSYVFLEYMLSSTGTGCLIHTLIRYGEYFNKIKETS